MSKHEKLQILHTALVDTRHGYDVAIKDGDNANVVAILQRVRDLHDAAHAEVHRLLTTAGEKADDSGSLMSSVHETVIAVRAATVGLDEGGLSAFASGEERNLGKYDEAIKAEPASAAELQRHRAALVAAVADMKRLAS